MLTNEIKKGTAVRMNHLGPIVTGTMLDSRKGNTRLVKVNGSKIGLFDDAGSVYAYNIVEAQNADGQWEKIEHTEAQKKLAVTVSALGF
mgnify:CR=1 FL=1